MVRSRDHRTAKPSSQVCQALAWVPAAEASRTLDSYTMMLLFRQRPAAQLGFSSPKCVCAPASIQSLGVALDVSTATIQSWKCVSWGTWESLAQTRAGHCSLLSVGLQKLAVWLQMAKSCFVTLKPQHEGHNTWFCRSLALPMAL